MKELMGLSEQAQLDLFNQTDNNTYNYSKITSGGQNTKSFILDRDFDSQPGEKVKLVGPDGEFEFTVGEDIFASKFSDAKRRPYVLKSSIPDSSEKSQDACGKGVEKLNERDLKKVLQDFYNVKYNFKFPSTPLYSIWSKQEQEPSEKQKEELNNGLDILMSLGKLDSNEKEVLFNKIINKSKFVLDEEGNWLPINKLTGNKVQYVEIIAEVIKNNFQEEQAKQLYCDILNGQNPNTLINDKYKNYLIQKIEELGFDWLKNQTNKIDIFSRSGKNIENNFKTYLFINHPNHEILYEGGDGNLVDINLSTDMIIDFGDENGTKAVQIKSNKSGAETMMTKYNPSNDFYKYLDWVIYPENDEWKYIDLSTGEVSNL